MEHKIPAVSPGGRASSGKRCGGQGSRVGRGELTGHAHRLTAEAGVVKWEDMICVLGDEPGTLSHEDHDPTAAPAVVAGQTYQIVIQQEYSLDGFWQKVVD